MDQYRRRPPMEGFSQPGQLGGEAFDDEVEGHIMTDREDPTRDISRLNVRRDDDDDTEGHRLVRATDDDDTEGHRIAARIAADDDTEGHAARMATDDDDTEGHASLRNLK